MTTPKWDEERTAKLVSLIGNETPVSGATVESVAGALGTTVRSVAAKLRKIGYEVASMAKISQSAFSEDEAAALADFVNANAGKYTYAEIAAQVLGGKFNTKQIQGKILSLELTKSVKPTEKVEVPRTYSDQEQVAFIQMVNNGAFVEDIAAKLNKTVNSVRGKALSLLRSGDIAKIPPQRESHAKDKEDQVEALGDISKMTVEEIAKAVEKTERGVRTLLTRRGLVCANYDGAAKKAKNEAKKAA